MSLIPKNGNDKVYTPDYLAQAIINHFKPHGIVLEPCRGNGSFFNILSGIDDISQLHSAEIDDGSDFFDIKKENDHYDFIVSNFPWSQMRQFLRHSMELSDNIISLSLTNALFMRARVRDMEEFNFGIKEISIIEPIPAKPWPQCGLSLSANHLQRGYKGDIKFSKLLNSQK